MISCNRERRIMAIKKIGDESKNSTWKGKYPRKTTLAKETSSLTRKVEKL